MPSKGIIFLVFVSHNSFLLPQYLLYGKLRRWSNFHHISTSAFPLTTYLWLPIFQCGILLPYVCDIHPANVLRQLCIMKFKYISLLLIPPILAPSCIALIYVNIVGSVKYGSHSTLFNPMDVSIYINLMSSNFSTEKKCVRLSEYFLLLI